MSYKAFLSRPVAVCSLIIMMLVLGINSYLKLGIDLVPKMNVPYVQIRTIYPGATPEEIEVEVARRIEDAVSSLDGVKHLTSVCMENVCGVSIEFQLGVDVDLAVHSVREKINMIIEDFPDEVETPILDKYDINAVSIVTLYLTGNCSQDELYDYVDDKLSDRFACLTGVSGVQIHGGNEMQLHVLLSPEKLRASGITPGDVVTGLKANNRKMPAGHVRESGREISITYDAEFHNIEDVKKLEIGKSVGKRIYLGDIADIRLQSKEIRQDAYFNKQQGVCIDIIKKGEANAVKVINLVEEQYNLLQSENLIPGGMELHWLTDSRDFIQASVSDAWESVIMGILLTAVLLFLFLHDVRTTLIVCITMPVSIVISFVLMKATDQTINVITLMSMGSAVGILVSNSIIVIENISKRLSLGDTPKEAAATGAGGVVIAVVASALTNVVVFLPMVTMSSVAGMVLAPFAGVMVISTLMSLFVSFSLTPIMAGLLLSEKSLKRSTWNKKLFHYWDKGYDLLCKKFESSVKWMAVNPKKILVVTLAFCIALGAWVLPRISLGFFASVDQGKIAIKLEFPSNYSLAETRARTLEIVDVLLKIPEVKDIGTTIGYVKAYPGQVSEGVHLAQITFVAKPKTERGSLEELRDNIRSKLKPFHNLLYSLAIPAITGDSSPDVVAYIVGSEISQLEKYNQLGIEELHNSGIATDIDSSVRKGKPQLIFTPQRPVLKNLGIDAVPLGAVIVGSFEGIEAGSYKRGDRSFDIRVKKAEEEGIQTASQLNIGSLREHPISVDVLTDQQMDNVSICLIRRDKERAAWLYANAGPGCSMGDVSSLMNQKMGKMLPPGYKFKFAGLVEMMNEGALEFAEVIILAILLTYLVIAAIMESWGKPFLIMFTIPLGFLGMMIAIHLAGIPLSMFGLLGGVMMIGIVVNNAILITDEASGLQKQGKSPHRAMVLATCNKFRPIVMTSIAAVVGMLPMAFGSGMGSELRASCGIALIGALVFSSVITLYVIPSLYFVFVKDKIEK